MVAAIIVLGTVIFMYLSFRTAEGPKKERNNLSVEKKKSFPRDPLNPDRVDPFYDRTRPYFTRPRNRRWYD